MKWLLPYVLRLQLQIQDHTPIRPVHSLDLSLRPDSIHAPHQPCPEFFSCPYVKGNRRISLCTSSRSSGSCSWTECQHDRHLSMPSHIHLRQSCAEYVLSSRWCGFAENVSSLFLLPFQSLPTFRASRRTSSGEASCGMPICPVIAVVLLMFIPPSL